MQIVTATPTAGVDTRIFGVFDDAAVVPANSVPSTAIIIRFVKSQYVQGSWPCILSKDWVNDLPSIAQSEGARRVELCYTAAQQRAGALLMQNDMIQYGSDPNAWPTAEQTRYNEMQRGLAYINAMNAAQQTIVSQTILNPCDDQYWPAPIDPIQL
jgi:hypothetical protein